MSQEKFRNSGTKVIIYTSWILNNKEQVEPVAIVDTENAARQWIYDQKRKGDKRHYWVNEGELIPYFVHIIKRKSPIVLDDVPNVHFTELVSSEQQNIIMNKLSELKDDDPDWEVNL